MFILRVLFMSALYDVARIEASTGVASMSSARSRPVTLRKVEREAMRLDSFPAEVTSPVAVTQEKRPQ